MRRSTPRLCAVALFAAAVAAPVPAQDKSHDALALVRAKAQAENQRVLVLLRGGDAAVDASLTKAMSDYETLGKLLRYECQVAALPVASLPGTALRKQLGLRDVTLPALALLDTDDRVLGTLSAAEMVEDGSFAPARVRSFVQKNACAPQVAREVLAAGLATAKQSGRHALVYLTAPW